MYGRLHDGPFGGVRRRDVTGLDRGLAQRGSGRRGVRRVVVSPREFETEGRVHGCEESGEGMKKVIEHLNRALSIEYSAVIQYCQHSALVQGTDRAVYEDFLEDASKEARGHAKKVSDWIVSLGGVPTIEAAHIRQATDLVEMLKQDLETENEALAAYKAAHAETPEDHPLRYMLEEQIIAEQGDVWEIEKYLSMHKIQVKTKNIDLAAS